MISKAQSSIYLAIAALVGCLTTPSIASAVTPAPPGTRAMWVWGKPDPNAIVAFAAQHNVSELFVDVSPTIATNGDLARLKALKALTDSMQIRLYALGGDPTWTTNHSAALQWQRAALKTGLFLGSHVDVEPYSLKAWTTQRASVVKSYLTLLGKLQSDSPLPLEVDVPFWFNTIPGGTYPTLADGVLAKVNAVTVMSYRDTSVGDDSIVGVGTDMLQRGSQANIPVRLGAETNAQSDCPKCDFSAEGSALMDGVLSWVDGSANYFPAFNGIAVHDYKGWSTMKP